MPLGAAVPVLLGSAGAGPGARTPWGHSTALGPCCAQRKEPHRPAARAGCRSQLLHRWHQGKGIPAFPWGYRPAALWRLLLESSCRCLDTNFSSFVFFALILFLLVLHTSSPSSFLHAVFHLRTDSWKQLNTVSLFGSQGIRVRADADFGHSTKCLPQLECAVG